MDGARVDEPVRELGRRIAALMPLVLLLSVIPAASPPAVARERPCSPAWTVTDTPDPDPLNSSLTAVDSRTSSDIWAVGYRSLGAQAVHWDGDSWTAVPMQMPDGAASMLASDVVSVGAEEAWAVGSYSGADSGARAFFQRWDGGVWSMAPSADLRGTYGQLYGIDAVSPDDVWAVGYSAGGTPGGDPEPLVMHHDGGSWHRVETPVPPGPNSSLWDVRAIASDDVWAVGSRQPQTGSSVGDRTLIMHWDGSTWTVVPSPEVDDQNHGLATVDGSGPNDVWAAGSIAGYRPVMEHWDGTSWTIVETGLADETAASSGIQDVEVLSAHDV